MKTMIVNLQKLIFFAGCVAMVVVSAAAQQQPLAAPRYAAQLQIDSLERLATKASQIVDVNVDERVLKLVPLRLLMESKDADERLAAQLLKELKGIFVRSYEFNNLGEYGESDIASIRTQLGAPAWVRIVNVIQKKDGRTVEVHMLTDNAKIGGLAVVAFEPRRLTLVNIVGNIDMDKLSRLEGRFGIPELNIGRGDDDDDDEDQKPRSQPAKKP